MHSMQEAIHSLQNALAELQERVRWQHRAEDEELQMQIERWRSLEEEADTDLPDI